MRLKATLVLLICLMSCFVRAQETAGRDFYKTLGKSFRIPRDGSPHYSFSIKFTTDSNRQITAMVVSDNTDSLLRREVERIHPLLNFRSLEELLLPNSEAVLPLILVHDGIELKAPGDKLMDFNGVTAMSKKHQLLPGMQMSSVTPIVCGRGRITYVSKPLTPLPVIRR